MDMYSADRLVLNYNWQPDYGASFTVNLEVIVNILVEKSENKLGI